MKPLRKALPLYTDRTSFLYLEKVKVTRLDSGLAAINEEEDRLPIPAARLGVLMLGPGCSLTQQAAAVLSECACPLAWVGEEGVRLYSFGQPLSGDTSLAERQAIVTANPELRTEAARRIFSLRFGTRPAKATVEELRGMEGSLTGEAYLRLAAEAGIVWERRQTERTWKEQDPANRALSAAHSCLYPLAASAILALGLHPGLGLIHRGNPWSLAFDLADMHKLSLAAPLAFREAAKGTGSLERRVREAMRDAFRKEKTMEQLMKQAIGFYTW